MRAMSKTGLAAVVGMGVVLSACGGAPEMRNSLAWPATAVGSEPAVRVQLINYGLPGTARPQEVIGDEHAEMLLDGAG